MKLKSIRRKLRNKTLMQQVRLKRLGSEARKSGHFDWSALLEKNRHEWDRARLEAKGKHVLVATNVGLNFGAGRIESLLAIALTLRGARVEFLLCDEALPACMAADTSWFSNDHVRFESEGMQSKICQHCYQPALEKLNHLGLKIHRLSEYLEETDRQQTQSWVDGLDLSNPLDIVEDGVALGEQALSGTLRYLARGTLKERHYPVLRTYLRAARLTALAVARLNKQQNFDASVLHHGIYIPQGTTAAVLRNGNTNVTTWFPAYRKRCFIFSHNDTYHRTMISEPVDVWENLELDKTQTKLISDYLKSRWDGTNDWISFSRKPELDFDKFVKARGIDPEKPIICLLTNVFWDAQLHYPESSFSNMREWLVETVRYFGKRPDLQLIIRVHPAETSGAMPARETAVSILEEDIGDLPDNVFVILPDQAMSTYVIASKAKACLIYATKTGIELLTMGIPVIAAGEAWVKGKNMSLDAYDWKSYFGFLDHLPQVDAPLGFKQRAHKYAYHFFFRRMIPLAVIRTQKGWPPFQVDIHSILELENGHDLGLDTICDGILKGEPYIYPAGSVSNPQLD